MDEKTLENLRASLAEAMNQAHREMCEKHAGQVRCRMWFRDDDGKYKPAYWNGTAWSRKLCESVWISRHETTVLIDKYGDMDIIECPTM